jgi:hypothetical protein
VCPEARCARPQPAAPALTVSGESALFYLWFPATTLEALTSDAGPCQAQNPEKPLPG